MEKENSITIRAKNPDDIPKLFVEFWNQRRADALSMLFKEDADFVNVVGLWWNNRKDIFKAHDYGLKVIFNNSSLSVIHIKTKLISGNFAVVHAKLKLEGQSSVKGIEAGKRKNILSFVVTKDEKGLWKAVSAQNTDIVGGAETNIRKEDGKLQPISYR